MARPKVELHLHLEGAAPPAFIRGLGREKKIDISGIFTPEGGYAYRDFEHFLSVYDTACTVLIGPEEFHRLVHAVLEESAANGVVYSETFLSPDFCGGCDLGAWREYLAAIREAAEQAETQHGITLRGIVTCIRHLGPEQAKKAAICAAETAGDWLVGFGMGGAENMGEQKDFAWAFDAAREAGLRLTTHAGEWRGPDEVRAAVRDLGVERVGHGVRAAEDPALVEELAEAGITLECCPGSNVFLGVYDRLEDHPIDELRRAGVNVTVSTDDPPFFHTTMRREYAALARCFNWDADVFDAVTKTALDAAFCDTATRDRIAKRLDLT
ncbi:adenosine deaminase [Pseudaestuariivita atlantica]|uniref:Adenosine deaminase n=1 Tax=Pseudaestuariivita atlantica TaxID=1317121 RepID=A0A0L1JVC5_9RHOB|nr:adenosine deaminase [Pseudaestuariivita atlantica]KNG95647.1 adenosine deaminase [Pseudaestuariivita atlantica]